MGNSLQNEPYWSKIHWELDKLRQNMPVQSQYAFIISILLSRIGARTGNIKTKLLMRHHMRGEGMATYSFRFLTSYSNIRILLRSKKYSNFEFYSYSLGALEWRTWGTCQAMARPIRVLTLHLPIHKLLPNFMDWWVIQRYLDTRSSSTSFVFLTRGPGSNFALSTRPSIFWTLLS